MSDSWRLSEAAFDLRHLKAYEGLFTLGSGYLHVRGALEEHLSGAPQNESYERRPANVSSEQFRHPRSKWGTYVVGLYAPHPTLNNQLVNLPSFLGLAPRIDGLPLDLAAAPPADYRRTLHLDTAVLERELTWQVSDTTRVAVRFERFISAARPCVCVQRLTMIPSRRANVEIRAQLDADVRTNGFDHFASVALDAPSAGALRCDLETDARDRVSIVSRLRGPVPRESLAVVDRRRGEWRMSYDVAAGEPLVVEKLSAVASSRDTKLAESHKHAARAAGASETADDARAAAQCAAAARAAAHSALNDAAALTFEQLLEEHVQVWRRRWDACDVRIEGDDAAQRAVRAALFHLLRAHPCDARVAIDAKGYAGEAYWGRFFWDTEIYLLPFFAYTDPPRARQLAEFRVRTLDGARTNARRYGYPGARYAWESDADGNECCPNWQYADHEVHVTADVAFGMFHYARAAADDAFLDGPAARVLVETARYWLARIDWVPAAPCETLRRAAPPSPDARGALAALQDRLKPVLLGVMGPDEYTPISSNNAFTNRMVALALRLAEQHGGAGGATVEERAAFAAVAAAMRVPRAADGLLVLQCDEFEALADLDFERCWPDRSRTLASQVSQERLYRGKCLKQADVLMLAFLLPDEFTPAELRRAWNYYLPLTSHDSSLSAGVHSILAARLGLHPQAWDFWLRACAIDLDAAQGGAAEGIHIANAGAIWQMVVFGFAGVRPATSGDVLRIEPRLPRTWKCVRFPLRWRGAALGIELTHASLVVRNAGPAAVDVACGDAARALPAGAEAVFQVSSSDSDETIMSRQPPSVL
ncbi:MAG: Alpha,alpha-trehalose phosphorylase [Phycisphaerae bacterium]|nr:Alpha,alpha-trehalose phosphorylase [Phycisphaerae bacterium]